MEEAILAIAKGCKLARELEANLPSLLASQQSQASQAQALSRCCDTIANMFAKARDALPGSTDHGGTNVEDEMKPLQGWVGTLGLVRPDRANETLGGVAAESLLQAQAQGVALMTAMPRPRALQVPAEMAMGGSQGGELQEMEVSADSGRASSSSQRSSRKRKESEKRVIRVPAPQMGNTEIPPEDGFTWRKYGQKEIYGCKFPRGYYRCTHQKLYQCQAKKQVQRLDEDPYIYQVTYRGDHTCHMTATAPSAPAPPPPPTPLPPPWSEASHFLEDIAPTLSTTSSGAPYASASTCLLSSWLSIDSNVMMSGGSSSISSTNVAAGPSTVRYGREAEDRAVADLADVMFNSGSSSGNSMDFIFPSIFSMKDKEEPREKN